MFLGLRRKLTILEIISAIAIYSTTLGASDVAALTADAGAVMHAP